MQTGICHLPRARQLAAGLVLSALAAFVFSAQPCHALPSLDGLLQGTFGLTGAQTANPAPAAGDITLPMPKGLAMVFRVAAVPTRGLLWSLKTTMGTSDTPAADRTVYDASYSALLSAPFPADSVPEAWRAALPKDGGGSMSCYLIAKYEVTRAQYEAVMHPEIEVPRQEALLPVTNISWYDAVAFTQRWTEWLLTSHPDALPTFRDDTRNTAFVRLPTEAEWEYAARGGQNESTNYRQQPFFSMPQGKTMADYAVFSTQERPAQLSPIGTRSPNPLGLHDTAGNAAEMTLDTFRFSVSGSLQGAAGGMVARGGSFRSDADGILPGRREEMPLFRRDGASRSDSLGFRPVVSGINTPGGGRMGQLTREYEQASGMSANSAADSAAATPMEELNHLINSARDPVLRTQLLTLKTQLGRSNLVQAQEQAARVENRVQQCLMTLESIRNIEHKSFILRAKELSAIDAVLAQVRDNARQRTQWVERKKAKQQELADNDRQLSLALDSYVAAMEDIARTDARDVTSGFQDLAALYRGEDRYNMRMSAMLTRVRGHYDRLVRGDRLSAQAVLDELVNQQ